jgi:site-specific DNA-methyltransferase (adenine-specific)
MKIDGVELLHGDCRELIKAMPDNSVDSIVTDPPYELGFMGKAWDSSGVAYDSALWAECLRVLKPGGHLLAFGGSRTYHRLGCAIEDAGFEIRDQIMWVYGSGFPKSHNVSKAIDKAAGVSFTAEPASGVGFMNDTDDGYNTTLNRLTRSGETTPEAQQWEGWGTALKPAHEPIVMARKPFAGSVAGNVLAWGTGAINIDGTRVPSDDGFEKAWDKPVSSNISAKGGKYISEGAQHTVDLSANKPTGGRFPANFIHDGSDEVLELFPETKSGGGNKATKTAETFLGTGFGGSDDSIWEPNIGSAARFFYCAKSNKAERNAGLGHLDKVAAPKMDGGAFTSTTGNDSTKVTAQNFHPTVKPLALMRYLIRMVTPPGGTVLEPFAGSGTTLMAAIMEGHKAIGCELTAEYLPIIQGRIQWAYEQTEPQLF